MSHLPPRRSARASLLTAGLLVGVAGCATVGSPTPEPSGPSAADASAEVPDEAEPGVDLDLPTFGEGVRADDAEQGGDDADAEVASSHVVEARDADGFAFAPETLTVAVGDTVTWEMVGDVAHTVTGTGLASGIVDAGGSFSATFEEPGEVAYICYLHPGMTGTVTVAG